MRTITFIDLFAEEGGLRDKFKKAFESVNIKAKCLVSSSIKSETIKFSQVNDGKTDKSKVDYITQQNIPPFDFLLASFPTNKVEASKTEVNSEQFANELFNEIQQILRHKKPYGFMIENIERFLSQAQLTNEELSKSFHHIIYVLQSLGYKISWKVIDSVNDIKNLETSGKKIFIIGTLSSQTVLSNVEKGISNYIKSQPSVENNLQHEIIKWLFHHDNYDDTDIANWHLNNEEFTQLQKDLIPLLLEQHKQSSQHTQPLASYRDKEHLSTTEEKEVYFKLYPPKKLVEITKEDGSITSLVHSFIFQEVFEETVKELDVTRNINSDLTALFASSDEQILVIDQTGKIIRVTGHFLAKFWQCDRPEDLLGKNINSFIEKNIFKPNIFELCKEKQEKVTAIQEANDQRIWSVATPVYKDEKLERVVVLSKDMTQHNPLLAGDNNKNTMTPDPFEAAKNNERQLIYRSKKIETILNQLLRVAPMNSTVLLDGESGVGKEVFAAKIHQHSGRTDKPYVRINSGAIPEKLIESELFGYEGGAFTGADKDGKPGYFEQANGGTIFLDEIGELPLNMQVKLLRVIQEREVVRIGGVKPISVDVRIIAATNQDLKKLVDEGKFREDLYYRLNVIPFTIPPLRDRKEDIFPLSIYFLEMFKRQYTIEKNFTPEALNVLEMFDWPGNIRELQNIIERLIIISQEEWITREDVLLALHGEMDSNEKSLIVLNMMPLKEAVDEVERQLISLGMKKYDTATQIAKALEISPPSLSRRMQKLNEK